MKLSLKLNPLLVYLLKRKTINYGGEIALIFGLWLITFILLDTPLSIAYISSTDAFVNFFRFVLMSAYPLIMVVPVWCAVVAAQPNRYTANSDQRELLLLTDLSTETITRTHIIAALFRLRWGVAIALGVAPMSFIVANVLWAVLQLGFGFRACLTTFIRNTYCGGASVTLLGPLENLDRSSFSLALLGLAVSSVGVVLLITTIGALLAIYRKNRVFDTVVAGGIAALGSFIMFAIVVPEVLLKSFAYTRTGPITLLAVLLMAVLPFVATFALIRLTSRAVQRAA